MTLPKDTRVLIAEDDFLVCEMIKGLLEDLGYEVVGEAADGLEAIDLAQALKPDVILMDIAMPRLDGLQAARRLLEVCPTPVVVLTAYETSDMVDEATDAGVGAYLVKPPRLREVERAITIAIARFEDIMNLRRLNAELQARNEELEQALRQVKTLSGLLPICASCKKVRNDKGYWEQVESYVEGRVDIRFAHGLCPECAARLEPNSEEVEG